MLAQISRAAPLVSTAGHSSPLTSALVRVMLLGVATGYSSKLALLSGVAISFRASLRSPVKFALEEWYDG